MVGFDVADACLPELRAAGRTAMRDGVEHLVFPLWRRVDDDALDEAPDDGVNRRRRRPPCG
jgi:hypothetical protein